MSHNFSLWKRKATVILAAAMDPSILILNPLLLFCIVWIFLLKPVVTALQWNDSEPSSVPVPGVTQPPRLLCSIPELSAGCGTGRSPAWLCPPHWEQLPLQVDRHNSVYRETLAERCFSLLAKPSCFSPEPPLHLPATGTALFWW